MYCFECCIGFYECELMDGVKI